MATRFYLASSGTAAASPAVAGAWEQSASIFVRMPTSTTKQNTALTDFTDAFGPASTGQTCWCQWISDTLDVDQSIASATADIVVRGAEAAASNNLYLAFNVRVISGDGSTVRGTLAHKGTNTGGSEYGTATRTRIWAAVPLSTVNALAGDRICIEIGFHGESPIAGASGTLRFGDPTAGTDHALTTNLPNDDVPWFEISQTLTFGTPSAGGTTSQVVLFF